MRIVDLEFIGAGPNEEAPEASASQFILPRVCLQAPEIIYPNRGVNTKSAQLEVNWDNPLTRDLAYFMFPGHRYCLVSGKPLEQTNPGEIVMDSNLFGRRCFRLDDTSDDTRITIDVSDDPYFDSFNGPFSMLAEWTIGSLGAGSPCTVSLNNNTTYHNVHAVAAANTANDPMYCQWVTSGSFRLQANSSTPSYSVEKGWNFVAALGGGTNDLTCLSNRHVTSDTTGTVPAAPYDSFAIGARRFSTAFANALDGGIAWAGLWKRRLSLGEAKTMRSNPYQILRLKR